MQGWRLAQNCLMNNSKNKTNPVNKQVKTAVNTNNNKQMVKTNPKPVVLITAKKKIGKPHSTKVVKKGPVVHFPRVEKPIHGLGSYSNDRKSDRPWYESVGRDIGGFLAKGGVQVLKALAGFGDYEVRSNSLLADATHGKQGSQIPQMINSPICNIFRHREFIGNVVGSTNEFAIQTLALNPGLDETFPWGSMIANAFTSYQLRGCVVELLSESSEYSSTPYLGWWGVASQYNVTDQPFTNKKAFANSEYANTDKPSRNVLHPIECAPDQIPLHQLLVRSGDVDNAQRILSDLCNVSIATGGQTSNGILGEAWLSYEVACFQPKLGVADGTNIQSLHYRGTGPFSSGLPLGVEGSFQEGSTIKGAIISTNRRRITFPANMLRTTYLFCIVWSSAVTTGNMTAPTYVFGSAIKMVPASFGLTPSASTSPYGVGASGANCFINFRFEIVSDLFPTNAYIEFDAAGIVPTESIVDVYVTQVPRFMKEKEGKVLVDDETASAIRQKERQKYIESCELRQTIRETVFPTTQSCLVKQPFKSKPVMEEIKPTKAQKKAAEAEWWAQYEAELTDSEEDEIEEEENLEPEKIKIEVKNEEWNMKKTNYDSCFKKTLTKTPLEFHERENMREEYSWMFWLKILNYLGLASMTPYAVWVFENNNNSLHNCEKFRIPFNKFYQVITGKGNPEKYTDLLTKNWTLDDIVSKIFELRDENKDSQYSKNPYWRSVLEDVIKSFTMSFNEDDNPIKKDFYKVIFKSKAFNYDNYGE